jgi:4-amino-4-deoxy-L-arabinose transferase-like glycosyltransferase
MSIKQTSYRKYILLVGILLILLLGAYLRLYKISEYLTFLGDEGRDVLVVKRMIVDHKFTLLGPTASVGGFFLGPIYYYFMLPFLWLWHLDPTGPAVMVALFGVATIYLVFVLGKKISSVYTGLVAASLYALSPVIIAGSRSSWNPNIVPFFSVLLMIYLYDYAIERKFWLPLVIGIILGIGIQLHYLFIFLFVVSGIWIVSVWYRERKFYLSDILGLTAGFIIGVSPFLFFELRHGFPNTISIFRFVTQGGDTGFNYRIYFTTILSITERLFGRMLIRFPDGGMLNEMSAEARNSWHLTANFLAFGSLILLGIFAAYIYRLELNQKAKENILIRLFSENFRSNGIYLLLLWFITVIGLFGLYKKPIYDYYLGIIFFAPFILVSGILYLIWKIPKIGKITSVILWFGLLFYNWQGQPFQYAPNNQLKQAKNIAKAAYDDANGKPFNFALIAGYNSDYVYRYFFEIWGNPPVTILNNVLDPDRKTVTDQLIVICEENPCQPIGHPLWEIAGFGQAEIANIKDVPFVKIYRLVHYKGTNK